MKKIYFIILITAILSILCSCSSPQPTPPVSAETLSLITSGYEYGPFDKYNSRADKNGFGGTKIYTYGTLESIDEHSYIIFGYVKINEKRWLIQICSPDFGSIYDYTQYIGKDVVICGTYTGFSETFKNPVIMADSIYVAETGETLPCLGLKYENTSSIKLKNKISKGVFTDKLISTLLNENFQQAKLIDEYKLDHYDTNLVTNSYILDFYDFLDNDEITIAIDSDVDDDTVYHIRLLSNKANNLTMTEIINLISMKIDSDIDISALDEVNGLVPFKETNSFTRYNKFNVKKLIEDERLYLSVHLK